MYRQEKTDGRTAVAACRRHDSGLWDVAEGNQGGDGRGFDWTHWLRQPDIANIARSSKEEALNTFKTKAEISHLIAESIKLNLEASRRNVEALKLNVEASKLHREHRWLPAVYTARLIAASITFAKLFLN